ncbi:YdcF family protein [Aquirufa aurantiipilula]|uniref:YdcF family protein n=1 Tax=Aquirufa aurantiipilula TaxID=2696561 RepID=UPI001CAA7349|nr:YdcF family protein [Aquirufa aurantiipilula]MBZ1325360.1 YdcF family protein [Aquirufa aurantiipilula]
MFFILSKIFDIILSPTVWIIIPLVIALRLKKTQHIRRAVLTSLILVLILTNGFICNFFIKNWEVDAPDIPTNKTYTWGIVLTGGMVKYADGHPNRISFGSVSDRMLQTFHLYQQGAIKKILVSGGETSIPNLIVDNTQESLNVRKLLIKMGVPSRDIFVENKARNTYENALYSSQMLKNYIKKDTVVVITSALHLRRAVMCFEKQGFNVRPYSADILKKDTQPGILSNFKPSEKSLENFFHLTREFVGIVVYKLQGYI